MDADIRKRSRFTISLREQFDIETPAGAIVDPSVFWFMGRQSGLDAIDMTFYVPTILLELEQAATHSPKHAEFPEFLLGYFGSTMPGRPAGLSLHILHDNIVGLKRRRKIFPLVELGQDEGVRRFVDSLFLTNSFFMEFSPRRNVLGELMGEILSSARRNKKPIIFKTRRFTNLLREKIIVTELPRQLDRALNVKRDICAPLFNYRGGQALKWFVGFVLTVGPAGPLATAAGLSLCFLDP